MFLVSVSLLTYNGSRFIKNCLRSVLAQTYPKIELLIIDNGSDDETVNLAKEIILKDNPKIPVRIIENEKNLGFSGGHNLGIRESKGELILFLNQDVILCQDFIGKIVGYFEKNKDKKIGSFQGKLLRLENNLQPTDIIDTAGFLMMRNRRIINRGQGEKDRGQFEKTEEIFGADGAAPVYRKEALVDSEIMGEYFDEEFFMYKEDVDLAWRLKLFGWESIFLPEAKAWHKRGAGEAAAMNYFSIIKERRKINKFGKFLAFRNQRLMQIKNELPALLFKHLPWILFKEIGAWLYVILFEPYTLKAAKDLIKMAPQAFAKRKIIMSRKRIDSIEMKKWFV